MKDLKIRNIVGTVLIFFGLFFLVMDVGFSVFVALGMAFILTSIAFATFCWVERSIVLFMAALKERVERNEQVLAAIKNKELDENLNNLFKQNGMVNPFGVNNDKN